MQGQFDATSFDLALVYTPGKSGTHTLAETLTLAFADYQVPVHATHWLDPRQIEDFRREGFEAKGEKRARQVVEIADLFNSCKRPLVVTSMRHPASRLRSGFYHRCSEIVMGCALSEGKIVGSKQFARLSVILGKLDIRKEEAWWRTFGQVTGFRPRDLPELAHRGFAVRQSAHMSVLVLRLEDIDSALFEGMAQLGYRIDHLTLPRGYASRVPADVRRRLDPYLWDARRSLRSAECFQDWATAYPDLVEEPDVQAHTNSGALAE